jgi:hypothetical protein
MQPSPDRQRPAVSPVGAPFDNKNIVCMHKNNAKWLSGSVLFHLHAGTGGGAYPAQLRSSQQVRRGLQGWSLPAPGLTDDQGIIAADLFGGFFLAICHR